MLATVKLVILYSYCHVVRASVSVQESISRHLVSPGDLSHTDTSVRCNSLNTKSSRVLIFKYGWLEQVYRTRQHFLCSAKTDTALLCRAKTDTTTPGKLGRAVGFWTRASRAGVRFEIVLLCRILPYCRFSYNSSYLKCSILKGVFYTHSIF